MVAAAVFLLLGACGLGTGVQDWSSGRTKSVVRATLIALPLLLVFGVLLRLRRSSVWFSVQASQHRLRYGHRHIS